MVQGNIQEKKLNDSVKKLGLNASTVCSSELGLKCNIYIEM